MGLGALKVVRLDRGGCPLTWCPWWVIFVALGRVWLCWQSSVANPSATCLASEGFLSNPCLMIIWGQVRNQRGAAGLKIELTKRASVAQIHRYLLLPEDDDIRRRGDGQVKRVCCPETGARCPRTANVPFLACVGGGLFWWLI